MARWHPRLGRGLVASRARLLPDALAGATLAAVAVPEALGYARIAGMPVAAGLYTMLLPLVVFALLGASRQLVVGADSATAVILASGLVGLAVPGSPDYLRLAALTALLVGVLLAVARVVRLGVLADFLSRTVLVGFLTGVGVGVGVRQLPDVLGLPETSGSTPERLVAVLGELPRADPTSVLVSAAVVVVVVGARLVDRRLPGALLAVVGAIAASALLDLDLPGVGAVPAGLPALGLPATDLADLGAVLPTALSMLVVILAQSAATARAYAARYGQAADTDADLVGLAGANVAAAVSGAFVVNGSPTKTQVAAGAGGRSQLVSLVAAALALLVVLLLAPALAGLPLAALAAVVLLIGVELVDVAGMAAIWRVRRAEFAVAVLTALAVVVLGVQTGILVAVAASIVDHLRHSYAPLSSVLAKNERGHWRSLPVRPGARTVEGLLVYRFGSGLYFANAARLVADLELLTGAGGPVRWLCLDAAAIGDIDYTAGAVLQGVQTRLTSSDVRLVLSNVIDPVRAQLARYGITATYYDTSGEVLESYLAAR